MKPKIKLLHLSRWLLCYQKNYSNLQLSCNKVKRHKNKKKHKDKWRHKDKGKHKDKKDAEKKSKELQN